MGFTDQTATSQKLQAILSSAVDTTDPSSVPGPSCQIISKDGTTLFQHAAGTSSHSSLSPQTLSDDSAY
jgi:hypothetical protein